MENQNLENRRIHTPTTVANYFNAPVLPSWMSHAGGKVVFSDGQKAFHFKSFAQAAVTSTFDYFGPLFDRGSAESRFMGFSIHKNICLASDGTGSLYRTKICDNAVTERVHLPGKRSITVLAQGDDVCALAWKHAKRFAIDIYSDPQNAFTYRKSLFLGPDVQLNPGGLAVSRNGKVLFAATTHGLMQARLDDESTELTPVRGFRGSVRMIKDMEHDTLAVVDVTDTPDRVMKVLKLNEDGTIANSGSIKLRDADPRSIINLGYSLIVGYDAPGLDEYSANGSRYALSRELAVQSNVKAMTYEPISDTLYIGLANKQVAWIRRFSKF